MNEGNDEIQKSPRWTVTLTSLWNTQTYGIVEFLRCHPKVRLIAGTLGILLCIGAFAGFAGVKIPNVTSYYFPCFILGPWLLYVATISGPDFQVVFPPQKAEEEKKAAEKQFEESNTVENAIKLDLSRLNEYYVINQSQARSSFRWAVLAMLLGFFTIISGVWFFYFREGSNTFMASLSTVAGIVVNLVGALFLRLHSKIEARSVYYFDQLSRLQQISIAIRLVDAHQNPEAQRGARNFVIRKLLSGSVTSVQAKKVNQDDEG